MKLDEIDLQLLELLQEDSRVNVKEIARRLNLTKTPVYERLKRYEKEGVIEKYVAILNPSKINSYMVVFCSVTLESQKIEAIQAFRSSVEAIPEVMECYLLGGANDFLLRVIVKDLIAYHQFSSGKLAGLPHVAKIQSTFVLDTIKRSTVLPLL